MNTHVIEITPENFQKVILEDSKEKHIVVAFWVAQMPESTELRDKLAAGLQGHEDAIVLATVDCESQQQIAVQFGIQGLPTAVVVKDGQPIDGLSGPQTDESINALLEKYLPKPQDTMLAQGLELMTQGKAKEAFTPLAHAHKLDEERADIKLVLVDVYIQTGKVKEAEELLSTIKMVDQDSHYQAMLSKLELASQAADSPEIQSLEAALQASPDDKELTHKLAAQYSQVNRHEDALVILFRLVQKDGSDQVSKDLLLDVLKALPDGDPLANKFRRKLYTLMY